MHTLCSVNNISQNTINHVKTSFNKQPDTVTSRMDSPVDNVGNFSTTSSASRFKCAVKKLTLCTYDVLVVGVFGQIQ